MAVIGSIAVEYLAQGARAFIQANKEAAASIAEVESKAKTVQDHLGGIVAPLADASKAVVRFGDGLIHSGQVLSTFAYRLMLITAPLAKFIYEVGQAGTELETVMAIVATQLDKGEGYIARFTEETTRYITDLSTEFPLATDDIAKAMYYLVSSLTIDPEVARVMLEPIAKAAVAGRTTAEEAAKAATVVMNVYDLISDDADETARNLEHVYDVIFEAVKKGRAEYEDMAVQLGDFVQFAKQAGATFEEAMALFAMATRVTTPAQAATWMSNLYRQFIRPEFAEEIAKWGVAISDVNGEMRSAEEVLADMAEAVNKAATEQEKLNMIAEAFPRIRAVQGFLVFLENLTEIEEWTRSFTEAVGTTEEAFAIMVDTVEAKLTILKNLFIAIGLEVFETYKEDLKRFLDFLADVLQKLREMDPELKKQALAWSAFLVALGPIALLMGTILMGLGSFITMLGALISPPVLGAVIAGFMLFGDELTALWDVIQGISWKDVVVALADVAVELGLISETQVGDIFAALGIGLKDVDLEKVHGLSDAILGLVDKFREIKQVGSDALAVVREFLDMVADRVGVVGTMVALLEGLASAFAGLLGGKAPEMGAVDTETWAKLLDIMLGLGIAIKVLPPLFAGLSAAVSGIAPLLLGIVAAVAGLNPLLLAAAAAVGTLFVAFGDWAAATEILSDIFGPLIERVREFVGGLVEAFYEGGLEGALEYFKEQWPTFAEDMKILIGEAADKSLTALGDFFAGWMVFLQENAPIWAENVKTWLVYIWETAIDWLGEHVPEWIDRLWAMLKDWIEGAIQYVGDHYEEWGVSIAEFLGEMWDKAIDWLGEHVPEWTARVWEMLRDWIEGAIQYVGDNYQGWGVSIAEFLGEMVGEILTFLTVTLPEWQDRLVQWFSEWANALIDWVSENWRGWAERLGNFMWDMALAMVDFLVYSLPEFQIKMYNWFFDMWVGFMAGLERTGPAWVQQLIGWFRDSVWQPFVDALNTTFALVGAGKALIQGLIDGIRAKAGDLVNAARGVVSDAIQAAKNLLGIESASKVFFEIGSAMTLGLVQGVEAGTPAVQKALGQIISGEALESTIEQMREFVEAFAELVVWYDELWDKVVKKSALAELELVFGGLGKMAETLVALSELAGITVPSLEELFALLEDLVDRMAAFVIQYDEIWDVPVKKHAIEELGMMFDMIAKLGDALEGLMALTGEGIELLAGPAWQTSLTRFFDALDAFITEFVSRAEVWQEQVNEQTAALAGWVGETVTSLTAAIEPLVELADYGPDQSAFKAGVDLFFANLEHFLDEFAWGMWRFKELASEEAAQTAELIGRAVVGLGETVQPLLDLAEYAPDPAAISQGIRSFFDHLGWFLDEFAARADDFAANISEKSADLAELLGRAAGGLGEAVQPLLDLAEYTVTPAEFARAADLFFDHLALFLEMFAERADEFDAHMTEEIAALAEAIGKAVGGIGAAIQPLIDLAAYGYAVDEAGNKVWWDPEDLVQSYEHFFYHLGMILYFLEEEARRWQVSDAAKTLAEAVGEVCSNLSAAVGFLIEVADYGVDYSAFALLGFQHFLEDLWAIVAKIEEASGTMGPAVELARIFAEDCVEVLSAIQRGIDKLNELTGLGVTPENLVEAGKLLIQSLADGFVEAVDTEWGRMLTAFSDQFNAFVNNWLPECMRVMHDRGWNIGANLIWGMIEGLTSQAAALYDTVWQIVQNAVARAEAAAEAFSESRSMWRLGANMVKGLIGGIEAQRGALAATLSGLADYGGFSLQPALAGVGAGGYGGVNKEVHYHYHVEATYKNVESPARIRDDIESLDWQRRADRV